MTLRILVALVAGASIGALASHFAHAQLPPSVFGYIPPPTGTSGMGGKGGDAMPAMAPAGNPFPYPSAPSTPTTVPSGYDTAVPRVGSETVGRPPLESVQITPGGPALNMQGGGLSLPQGVGAK